MTHIYILIMIVWGINSVAITTQEFYSQEKCEIAQKESNHLDIKSICVEK